MQGKHLPHRFEGCFSSSFTSTTVRLSHRMLSLSLPELEQSAEQSRKDCKALQEERERREKELTQVRFTHRRNAVVCKEREEKSTE